MMTCLGLLSACIASEDFNCASHFSGQQSGAGSCGCVKEKVGSSVSGVGKRDGRVQLTHCFIEGFHPINNSVALVLQAITSARDGAAQAVNAIAQLGDAEVEGVQGQIAHGSVDHPGEWTDDDWVNSARNRENSRVESSEQTVRDVGAKLNGNHQSRAQS